METEWLDRAGWVVGDKMGEGEETRGQRTISHSLNTRDYSSFKEMPEMKGWQTVV